jgi:CheY-like chemotaxis protein
MCQSKDNIDTMSDVEKTEPNTETNQTAQEKYILIADDQPDISLALQIIFQSKGYTVKVVDNGKKAWESVQANKPILVVSDILMPLMNGLKLCENIKSTSQYSDIPVILLTAVYRQQHHIDMAFGHGADAYFSKPFNAERVLEVAEKLIKETHQEK